MAKIEHVHSRYECKYLVDRFVCEEIRAFMKPFMQPDPYAIQYPNYTYPICSLYLDSPDLLLYNQVLGGEKNRFKLRVRTYSDDPRTPVFFEVKRRINLVLHKRRAVVDREFARAILTEQAPKVPSGLLDGLMPEMDEFTAYRLLISGRPVVRVKYMREAYESKAGEPVRVTFDTELCHAVTFDGTLSHTEGEWVETPPGGVILEIKFTDRFPTWARDLVEVFQLTQRSVPKYVMSVDRILDDERVRGLSLAGFTLPPQQRVDVTRG